MPSMRQTKLSNDIVACNAPAAIPNAGVEQPEAATVGPGVQSAFSTISLHIAYPNNETIAIGKSD